MPELIAVDDPEDPRIAAYTQVRERDLAGHGERFVAEGEVVLDVLLAQRRYGIESLLVSEKRIAPLTSRLHRLAAGTPVHVASQAVMDRVVGFHIHCGVLALGRRGIMPGAAELLSSLDERALVVVLVGIANHDNAGGIFRNAAAFGADAVLLDAASCDPLYRKAIRVSVGGVLLVPFARLDRTEDPIDLLARFGFTPLALSPRGREPLHAMERPHRTALLLGAEGPGLPDDILSRSRTVRIPMAGALDSLNVATASGIALHHLTKG